jgi:hypothetical protein
VARRCAPRVGHSFIKQVMAETGAVFGGEHSAHYYFRDFWRADSGMLAALHVLAALGEADGPLSALMADYERYIASGEVNSTVADGPAKDRRDQGALRRGEGVRTDELDGLTVELPVGSWFNLRPSNTEPLLRLNVEGPDARRYGGAARRGPRDRPGVTGRGAAARAPPRPPARRTGSTTCRSSRAPRTRVPECACGRRPVAASGHRPGPPDPLRAAHEGGRPWPSRSTPG